MERLASWLIIGGIVGAVAGYLFQAQQHLQPHQSRLRWIPALVVGSDVRALLRVLAWVALGAGMGVAAGWICWTGLEALTGA